MAKVSDKLVAKVDWEGSLRILGRTHTQCDARDPRPSRGGKKKTKNPFLLWQVFRLAWMLNSFSAQNAHSTFTSPIFSVPHASYLVQDVRIADNSPRLACLLTLFTLARIACPLHICDKINRFELLYLGPCPNNYF